MLPPLAMDQMLSLTISANRKDILPVPLMSIHLEQQHQRQIIQNQLQKETTDICIHAYILSVLKLYGMTTDMKHSHQKQDDFT